MRPWCCCRSLRAPAYIEAIARHRCTWLTAVPPMIAMMLRERDLIARTDLGSVQFVRMGSAPVSRSLMQALHRTLPEAKVTNAYGTTEAGPVVFGPHPRGLAQPEASVGYPHPKVALRLDDGGNGEADQGELEMKSPAMMLGYHNRPDLPFPSPPTASTAPATCSAATPTASIIFSAAPTTCSCPAARTSTPATSNACWNATPPSPRPAWCRSTTTSRARSRSPSSSQRADRRSTPRRSSGSRSPTRPPISTPVRLVRRPPATVHDQQDRPRRAQAAGGGSISRTMEARATR